MRRTLKSPVFDAANHRANPKMIARYLNDALATDDAALITKAIGDLTRAQGRFSSFSRKVGLRREGLYRSFKGENGPGFGTVMKVLLALNEESRELASELHRAA